MDTNIKRTINGTIDSLKNYEALLKNSKLREARTNALVNAIAQAVAYLINNHLTTKDFLLDRDGLTEIIINEDGETQFSNNPLISYERNISMSGDEVGYVVDKLRNVYPSPNFVFGYRHYGHVLTISVNP